MAQPIGRPKGDEETVVIAIRIPLEMRERLDRHLDRLESRTGLKGTRAAICRHALKTYLDAQEDH